MAIFRLFPESDTFLYTEETTGNAGLDEILELGGYPVSQIGQTSRLLVKYSTSQIQDVVNNKIGDNTFSSSLHLYLASAYELPHSYSINAYPVYDQWTPGIGKYGDSPVDKSGASWLYTKGQASVSRWTLPENSSPMPAYVTGSYNETYSGGGGSWYTGSAAGLDVSSVATFELTDDHDIDIDVTNAVLLQYSESIDNNGYIVKLTDDLEFNTTSSIRLKYYSADTNTIYPPYLEFKWDDSSYVTGSLTVVDTDECSIRLTNNRGRYVDEGKQRFRLHARPKYIARTFTTGSAYTQKYALPVQSYWGIRDEFTEEMIIPFDTEFTKISCDSNGPYFDIFMDGLQPERYYRLLIKSLIDGTNTVINTGDTFKIVRNG